MEKEKKKEKIEPNLEDFFFFKYKRSRAMEVVLLHKEIAGSGFPTPIKII